MLLRLLLLLLLLLLVAAAALALRAPATAGVVAAANVSAAAADVAAVGTAARDAVVLDVLIIMIKESHQIIYHRLFIRSHANITDFLNGLLLVAISPATPLIPVDSMLPRSKTIARGC